MDRKKLPASDIEKKIKELIKRAVQSLTQMTEEAASGCLACRKVIQLQPAQVTTVTYSSLTDIIRSHMPLSPGAVIKQCDSFITTYPDEIFMDFMQFAMLVGCADYQVEQYDCDDFSIAFAALARKWHARLRMQLESVPAVKRMLPAAPAVVGASIIPHREKTEKIPPPIPSVSDVRTPASGEHYIGGVPVGICHGKLSATSEMHAFNFWVSSKGEIVYIEPQTGEFITFGEGAMIDFVYI